MLTALEDALRGTTPLYEAEFRVRREDDGRWVWLRGRGRVVERDPAGKALRLVGTDADVSKRKASEAQMRQRAEVELYAAKRAGRDRWSASAIAA